MRIKKIIITTNEPYRNREFRRQGVPALINAGFDVEIWNEERFVFRVLNNSKQDLYVGEIPVRSFESQGEFLDAVNGCGDNVVFLNYYPDSLDTGSLIRAKVKYCNICCDNYLSPYSLRNIDRYYNTKRYKHLYKNCNNDDVIHAVWKTCKQKYNDFKLWNSVKKWPPMYNFMGTPADYSKRYSFSKNRTVLLHSFDYDEYLKDKERDKVRKDHIVFIDAAWGVHPEGKQMGRDITSREVTEYRANMIRLFEKMEALFDKEVVIAAHPKAEYQGGEFGARKIEQFSTYELIKNSCLVIGHQSTSLGWAMLFDKPILSVINNKMRKWSKIIEEVNRQYLGMCCYNYDEDSDPGKYVFYDKKKYLTYINDFMCADRSNQQLIIDRIIDLLT